VTRPCPDWRGLAAHRNERAAAEPAGWQSAVEADPTLLFHRFHSLPGRAAERSLGEEAAEVESMRQAVAAMRTARRLEPSPERAAWKRWVAAAALAAAALSLGAGHGLHPAPAPAAPATPAAIALVGGVGMAAPALPPAVPRFVSEPVPMVEELNRPAARVYQMDGGKNLSVVMIVDERFDV
jgi:hypothetical protein